MNKKKSIIILIILLLIIPIFTSLVNIQETVDASSPPEEKQPAIIIDLKKPKSSGALDFFSLHIDDFGGSGNGTWEWVKDTYAWCTLIGNTYILEDLTLTNYAVKSGSTLWIGNSSVNFIIQNCTIMNSGLGSSDAGIRLTNVTNGMITDCNLTDNFVGIRFDNYGAGYSINNVIKNNSFNTNSLYSLQLLTGNNQNDIINNTIMNSGSYGVNIETADDCVLENNTIDGAVRGISIFSGDGSILRNNTFSHCSSSGIVVQSTFNGFTLSNNTLDKCNILLSNLDKGVIRSNTINNGSNYGIRLYSTYNLELSGNIMQDCGIIWEGINENELRSSTIYVNNTVNGKPVYFYKDESSLDSNNFTCTGQPGQILLVNCSYCNVSNFNLSNASVGVELCYSEYNTISNITANNGYKGIYLRHYNHNNTIFNNTVNENSYGIDLYNNCDDNNITGNIGEKNVGSQSSISGVRLYFSDYCNIKNNLFTSNYRGITLETSTDCIITNNTLYDNDDYGIYLGTQSNNNFISNNTAYDTAGVGGTQNGGLYIVDSQMNNITYNNFSYNEDYGILIRAVFSQCFKNNISYNMMKGNRWNIYLLANRKSDIHNNTIYNNDLSFGIFYGVYMVNSSDNTLTNNEINNCSQHGVYLENSERNCFTNNTINYNGILSSNYDGIYLIQSHWSIFSNNTILNNYRHGIHFRQTRNSKIINNTVMGSVSGIKLEDDCDENTIQGNKVHDNLENGIKLLSDCDNNRILENLLYNNTLSGIFLNNNCENNLISGNIATFNVKAGIYLNISNSNRIYSNTAKNNTYGLLLNASSYNCIYGNILVNNTYNYNQSGTCVGNGDCRGLENSVIPEGDDSDDDDDNIGALVVLVIVIIIVSLAAGIGIIYALIKKGVIGGKKQELIQKKSVVKEEKSIPLKLPKGPIKDGTLKKEIPPVIDLTEVEKKEIEKTEAEIDLEKKEFICVVHRGAITGRLYVCPSCQTVYCEKCAKVLKKKDEKCWSCNNKIEL